MLIINAKCIILETARALTTGTLPSPLKSSQSPTFEKFFNFDNVFHKCFLASNFFVKETLEQAFSCEFCEIFRNTIFIDLLRATASE